MQSVGFGISGKEDGYVQGVFQVFVDFHDSSLIATAIAVVRSFVKLAMRARMGM